jgi:hypothetical protein
MSEQLSDGEPNLAEIRRAAVRYWEKRRIVYNVLLVPPSIVSYSLGAMSRGGGSDSLFTTPHALLLFAMAALGANVCYSFVYALEFWFGNRNPDSLWNVGTSLPMTRRVGLAGSASLGRRRWNIALIRWIALAC